MGTLNAVNASLCLGLCNVLDVAVIIMDFVVSLPGTRSDPDGPNGAKHDRIIHENLDVNVQKGVEPR